MSPQAHVNGRAEDRAGLTLLELIVVLAVIAILAALILPAVHSARGAARRSQCASNLRQIGLALHSYHDAQRSFPPGGISPGNWQDAPVYGTWTLSILPHVEESALYEMYVFEQPTNAPVNAPVREHHVPLFACPSDVHEGELGSPESGPGSGELYAVGSYRAVSGRSDGESRPLGGSWFDAWNLLPKEWRGAMHHVGTSQLRSERMSDVLDGLSNTLLVGEYSTYECRMPGPGPNNVCRRATFWAYGYTSYNQSSVCPECGSRMLLPDYDGCVRRGGVGNEHACKRGWGSFHKGGFQALTCAGDVRLVNSNIDMELLGGLATIAGNEPTPGF